MYSRLVGKWTASAILTPGIARPCAHVHTTRRADSDAAVREVFRDAGSQEDLLDEGTDASDVVIPPAPPG